MKILTEDGRIIEGTPIMDIVSERPHKGNCSVEDAIVGVWPEIKDTFYGPTFCIFIRIITNRPILMDGTILRKLRRARLNGKINYKCVDSDLSIYKKL